MRLKSAHFDGLDAKKMADTDNRDGISSVF